MCSLNVDADMSREPEACPLFPNYSFNVTCFAWQTQFPYFLKFHSPKSHFLTTCTKFNRIYVQIDLRVFKGPLFTRLFRSFRWINERNQVKCLWSWEFSLKNNIFLAIMWIFFPYYAWWNRNLKYIAAHHIWLINWQKMIKKFKFTKTCLFLSVHSSPYFAQKIHIISYSEIWVKI